MQVSFSNSYSVLASVIACYSIGTRSQHLFFAVFTSSLALQLFKFGLGFPHDKLPFLSLQSSCSSSFYTHTAFNSNSTSTIQLNLRLPFSPLPPGLPSSNFCTFLSPPILTTSPSHSDLRTSVTVTIAGDLNFLLVYWCSGIAQSV
jgi:hypothetical protein